MNEHDFNPIQNAAVLREIRKFADEEAQKNPIFYKGEFREDEWFSLLNSGELISKNTLRNQEGIGGYLRIMYQIDRLGWATLEQIENCRWAITPEGLERVRKEIESDERSTYTVYTNPIAKVQGVPVNNYSLEEIRQAHEALRVYNRTSNQMIANLADFIVKPRTVHYDDNGIYAVVLEEGNDDPPKPVGKLYTFEDIKKAWLGFKELEGGPWEGNFPDFLYGYAFPEYKNIKEVKPVFHDRLMAEPKLTKE